MNSGLFQKVLPHSTEAEEAVLGCLLLDPRQLDIVADMVREEDFYHAASQFIFRAICEVYEAKKACDALTVSDHLDTAGKLEEVGGSAYIFSLPDRAVTAATAPHYAKIVQDRATYRRVIQTLSEAQAQAYECMDQDPLEIITSTELALGKLQEGRAATGFVDPRITAHETYESLERRSKAGPVNGIRTGFHQLDGMLSGLQNTDLIIVGARPAMGKTTFALNIADFMAVNQKKNVCFFSLEMSREQLAVRLLCGRAAVDPRRLHHADYVRSEKAWEKLAHEAGRMSDGGLWIDDTANLTFPLIRARARRMKAEGKCDVLILDYLQQIASQEGRRRNENREREVAEYSRGLKQLAKELNVPAVVLAQLNRKVEETRDKKPNLSHLRESGSLEQDADVVMFLYRPQVYFPEDKSMHGKAEVIVAKHRNGPIGEVPLLFIPERTQFCNLENRYGK